MSSNKPKARILVIDDDESVCSSLVLLLKQNGFACSAETDPTRALKRLEQAEFDLLLQDMNFSRNTSGDEGLELLKQIRQQHEQLPVILITAWATIELAVSGIKHGANDFVAKPWDNEQLIRVIRTNLELSRSEPVTADRVTLDESYDFDQIIGTDPAMVRILSVIARVARTDAAVLVLGETGTGKELIADAIHNNSSRASMPLVKVNLGGIPASLFESEMFGHVRGAFTDAHRDRQGRFEQANGGTLFLDEIGDLDQASQAKLLRVLQDQQYQAVGDSTTRRADVRIVSATSRPLSELVASGHFREDLLYRLNLITVELPPLRSRRSDIAQMADRFLSEIRNRYQLETRQFSDSALSWLKRQQWPGNVRQLKQTIERTVLMSDGTELNEQDLIQSGAIGSADADCHDDHQTIGNGMTLDQVQSMMIRASLDRHEGNISRTADELGISRAALYRRLEKYGIESIEESPDDDPAQR